MNSDATPGMPTPSAPSTHGGQTMDRVWIRNLLDASDEAIYFKDLQSRFIRVSLGMANLHGLTQERMCGLTDFDLFAEAHAADALADEQEIIRTGVPILNKEECESFADRPTRWVATSKFPLRDLDGAIIPDTPGADRSPSSDTAAHAHVYRHMPHVGGVVHTHSPYATAWAARREPIPCVITGMADEFGGAIPVGRLHELARMVRDHRDQVIDPGLREILGEIDNVAHRVLTVVATGRFRP